MEEGNTVSDKYFLIYMLTDCLSAALLGAEIVNGLWNMTKRLDTCFITSNSYFAILTEAGSFCTKFPYPKEGIAWLWRATTTAMKMKAERSLELMFSDRDALCTAE